MSEGVEIPKQEEPDEKLMIQVYLTKEGAVKVQGAIINDPMAFYGLMEMANQSVMDYHKMKSQSKIIKGNGHGIMDFARRFNR